MLKHLVSVPGYCRAFAANYSALKHEYRGFRFPRYSALADLLSGPDNPFILSDLAVYHLQAHITDSLH